MSAPEPSDPPWFGRKPRWQLRWEARSQRKFDQQSVDAATWKSRRAEVRAPDGKRYDVRTVENGMPLTDDGVDTGLFLVDLSADFVALAFYAIRVRMRTGWTVGAVEVTTSGSDEVIWEEMVTDEADIESRVRELAARIQRGELPKV